MVSDSYNKLVNSVYIAPASNREDSVFRNVESRIQKSRIRTYRTKVIAYICIILGAAVFVEPSLNLLWRGARNSGFLDYLSLVIDSSAYVAGTWKGLILSLAESLPAIEIASVVAILIVIIYSAKHMISALRNLSSYRHGDAMKLNRP